MITVPITVSVDEEINGIHRSARQQGLREAVRFLRHAGSRRMMPSMLVREMWVTYGLCVEYRRRQMRWRRGSRYRLSAEEYYKIRYMHTPNSIPLCRISQSSTGGSVTYNNNPYSKFLKSKIGFVTQDDVLFPHLTVENHKLGSHFLLVVHEYLVDNDNRPEDTLTLIDRKDNVFIISNFKSKYPVLQLDLRQDSWF
ncbi:hypothetical protein AALP_AA8G254600 [Arabis alpina]|uniref:Uncharacterized protein n=1 Tax=Arabis alpina TaxID=50452 RepID=A0A087G9C8_ARAAL|nr:hypothetical protein AALP_AA8G254600 [Arabis alpina]